MSLPGGGASPASFSVDEARSWKPALVGGTLVWLASRIFIQLVGAVVLVYSADPAPGAQPGFLTFQHWDSGWFERIAVHGYSTVGSGRDTVAFFPGYPLASRLIAAAVGAGSLQPDAVGFAMWFVSAVASWTAAVVFWRSTCDDFGRAVATRADLLLFFGPYALFLVASYSAALYLAAAVTAWWLAARQRYWAAGILGALASLTRVSGLFLASALLVMYVLQRRQQGRPVLSSALAGISLSWLGGLGYLAYAGIIMGSFTGWFQVQAGTWGRHLTWPWQSFISQGGRMLHDAPERQQQAWLEMVTAVICVASLVAFVVLRMWPEVVYVGLSLAVLMTSTSYESLAGQSDAVPGLRPARPKFPSVDPPRPCSPSCCSSALWFLSSTPPSSCRAAGPTEHGRACAGRPLLEQEMSDPADLVAAGR